MNIDILFKSITMATAWRTDCGRSEYKQRTELGGYFTSLCERMMVAWSRVMAEGSS